VYVCMSKHMYILKYTQAHIHTQTHTHTHMHRHTQNTQTYTKYTDTHMNMEIDTYPVSQPPECTKILLCVREREAGEGGE